MFGSAKSPGSELTSQENLPEHLMVPANAQRALDIINSHIDVPKYERVVAFYYVGRQAKWDFESLKDTFQADKVELGLADYRPGNNFITKHFHFEFYKLLVTNPKTAFSQLTAGKNVFPLTSLTAFNAGNMPYANIRFDAFVAQTKPEFVPELEALGYACYKAGDPRDPFMGIREGPCRNVETLEEAFGPGAEDWVKSLESGDGDGVLIINR